MKTNLLEDVGEWVGVGVGVFNKLNVLGVFDWLKLEDVVVTGKLAIVDGCIEVNDAVTKLVSRRKRKKKGAKETW